jgi:hypothetical protein
MGLFLRTIAASLAVSGVIGPLAGAEAAEGGASFYVPGFSIPMAGVLPPPGAYFDNTAYFYDAKIAGGRTTSLGGNVVAEVKVNIWADFVTGLWFTPAEILGGNLAFGITVPFGEPAVRAGVVINGPIINRRLGRPLALTERDKDVNFGDPVVGGMIGWHSGNWHWKVGAATSIPAGAYEPGELSNVAFNRWIGDFYAGLTYLDPALGIDLSASGGFTINGENPATNYRTGTELHFDVSAMKFLTKEFSFGVLAAHYQQISGDSGQGASLGPYKGRVTAVGGTVGYDFQVGQIPISTRLKVLREVDVENRFQGTIGFLQVSFPLWVQPGSNGKAQPPISAHY